MAISMGTHTHLLTPCSADYSCIFKINFVAQKQYFDIRRSILTCKWEYSDNARRQAATRCKTSTHSVNFTPPVIKVLKGLFIRHIINQHETLYWKNWRHNYLQLQLLLTLAFRQNVGVRDWNRSWSAESDILSKIFLPSTVIECSM